MKLSCSTHLKRFDLRLHPKTKAPLSLQWRFRLHFPFSTLDPTQAECGAGVRPLLPVDTSVGPSAVAPCAALPSEQALCGPALVDPLDCEEDPFDGVLPDGDEWDEAVEAFATPPA